MTADRVRAGFARHPVGIAAATGIAGIILGGLLTGGVMWHALAPRAATPDSVPPPATGISSGLDAHQRLGTYGQIGVPPPQTAAPAPPCRTPGRSAAGGPATPQPCQPPTCAPGPAPPPTR